jgi:putative hydrolase of the HAD superfamily
MKYTAVLFDLYGTLVVIDDMETEFSEWLECFYNCLKPHGIDIPRESFNEWCIHHLRQEPPFPAENDFTIFERRIQGICTSAKLKLSPDNIRRTAVSLLKVWDDYCVIDPDCQPLLEKLTDSHTLGVISNYDHPQYIRGVLKNLDLEKYFSTVIVSGEHDFKKPDPRMFHMALEEIGLLPRDVIYLGDSEEDITGARAAGIEPVLIRRDISGKPPPDIFKRDYNKDDVITITRLPELLEILEG